MYIKRWLLILQRADLSAISFNSCNRDGQGAFRDCGKRRDVGPRYNQASPVFVTSEMLTRVEIITADMYTRAREHIVTTRNLGTAEDRLWMTLDERKPLQHCFREDSEVS